MRLSTMGITVPDGSFWGPSGVFLRLFGHVPGAVTERFLFGYWPGSGLLQKALQWFLGGPRLVRVHFTAGPIEGSDFDCWTAEQYFILGARYERAVTSALQTLVQREDVVYDVGAHAGFSALVFARLADRGTRLCLRAVAGDVPAAPWQRRVQRGGRDTGECRGMEA
jgi:hypothetical protein